MLEGESGGETLGPRGMLYDLGDVKRRLMEFIDTRLDHKMLLRKGDPLIAALAGVGEGEFIYEMDVNPTAENIAKLICLEGRNRRLPLVAVRLCEAPTSYAEYRI